MIQKNNILKNKKFTIINKIKNKEDTWSHRWKIVKVIS